MLFRDKNIVAVIVVMVFFISDRIVKYCLVNNIFKPEYGFISLVENKGIAFGIGIPKKLEFIFYFILIFVFLFLVNWLIKSWREKDTIAFFSIGLIIAGAISNIIDRIRYGAVIDFIDLRFWPVFNLADILIVAGVIMLVIDWGSHGLPPAQKK